MSRAVCRLARAPDYLESEGTILIGAGDSAYYVGEHLIRTTSGLAKSGPASGFPVKNCY